MTYPSGPLREPGPMAQPPRRNRSCPHCRGRLERLTNGRFSCKKCGRTWDEAELSFKKSD